MKPLWLSLLLVNGADENDDSIFLGEVNGRAVRAFPEYLNTRMRRTSLDTRLNNTDVNMTCLLVLKIIRFYS